jgi:hypothetical protein
MKDGCRYEYAMFSDELLRRKVTGDEEIPRWLVEDHGALEEALRREKARGGGGGGVAMGA